MKSKITFIALLLTTLMNLALVAQEKKNAPTSLELFKEIEHADSIMFDAFNRQDMVTFKAMFTKDLEWFQDNGGLIFYRTVFQNFETNFRNENKLSRILVKGSMEVHPIKGYGAIQIGSHQFSHIENGKEELGTFKFLMIWQNISGKWKISRVISYDH
jgi:ketosteroid isomerase-like protein